MPSSKASNAVVDRRLKPVYDAIGTISLIVLSNFLTALHSVCVCVCVCVCVAGSGWWLAHFMGCYVRVCVLAYGALLFLAVLVEEANTQFLLYGR